MRSRRARRSRATPKRRARPAWSLCSGPHADGPVIAGSEHSSTARQGPSMTDAVDTPSTTEATSTDGALPLTDSPTTSRTPDEPGTPDPGDKTALIQEL